MHPGVWVFLDFTSNVSTQYLLFRWRHPVKTPSSWQGRDDLSGVPTSSIHPMLCYLVLHTIVYGISIEDSLISLPVENCFLRCFVLCILAILTLYNTSCTDNFNELHRAAAFLFYLETNRRRPWKTILYMKKIQWTPSIWNVIVLVDTKAPDKCTRFSVPFELTAYRSAPCTPRVWANPKTVRYYSVVIIVRKYLLTHTSTQDNQEYIGALNRLCQRLASEQLTCMRKSPDDVLIQV